MQRQSSEEMKDLVEALVRYRSRAIPIKAPMIENGTSRFIAGRVANFGDANNPIKPPQNT
jgi:hypothetical protein